MSDQSESQEIQQEALTKIVHALIEQYRQNDRFIDVMRIQQVLGNAHFRGGFLKDETVFIQEIAAKYNVERPDGLEHDTTREWANAVINVIHDDPNYDLVVEPLRQFPEH